jgi:hypothetical protein
VRGVRPALIALLGAFVLAAAGCGGGGPEYSEVELPPPALPIPRDTAADPNASLDPGTTSPDEDADDADAGDPTATDPATSTAPDTATDGADTGGTTAPPTGTTTDPGTATPPTDTGTTTDPGTDTGGATPDTPDDTATDTGGAAADQGLDQFCADNPGACDG